MNNKLKTSLQKSGWLEHLSSFFDSVDYNTIRAQLESGYAAKKILPAAAHLFRPFETPFDQIKVVIIGDKPGMCANGLAFGMQSHQIHTPEIAAIIRELKRDFNEYSLSQHGTLEGWQKQHVLLLNTSLTNDQQIDLSKLVDLSIKTLSDTHPFIVFILWGPEALSKIKLINRRKHAILTAPLPGTSSFNGCGHFSQANELFKQRGLPEINWLDIDGDDNLWKI